MESPTPIYKKNMEDKVLVFIHPERYNGLKHLKLDTNSKEVTVSLWSNFSVNPNQPDSYICLSHSEAIEFFEAGLNRLRSGVDVPDPRQLAVGLPYSQIAAK